MLLPCVCVCANRVRSLNSRILFWRFNKLVFFAGDPSLNIDPKCYIKFIKYCLNRGSMVCHLLTPRVCWISFIFWQIFWPAIFFFRILDSEDGKPVFGKYNEMMKLLERWGWINLPKLLYFILCITTAVCYCKKRSRTSDLYLTIPTALNTK